MTSLLSGRRDPRPSRRRTRPSAVYARVSSSRWPPPSRAAFTPSAPPFKVIALDCDDTLWAGICGEDGPQGVVLDRAAPRAAGVHGGAPARGHAARAVQQEQRRGRGRDLPRASRDAAAARGFRGAPRSTGRARRANLVVARRRTGARARFVHPGRRQSQGVHGGAGRRARKCSRCRCRPMPPRSPSSCSTFGPSTAPASPTRTAAAPSSTRSAPSARAPSARRPAWKSFWRRCNWRVAIAPMQPAQVARVAQLTQRTNQMNATLRPAHRGGDSGAGRGGA